MYSKCECISGDWLLSGKGEIFQTKSTENVTLLNGNINGNKLGNKPKVQKTLPNELNAASDITTHCLPTDQAIAEQSVPLFDLKNNTTSDALFGKQLETKNFLYIPDLPPCDGAIMMHGDQMSPELKSGDVIIYKRVKDMQNGLFFGQIYIVAFEVDGEEHIMVKYIRSSEDKDMVTLACANTNYSSNDIPRESIKALAMVKASLRYRNI